MFSIVTVTMREESIHNVFKNFIKQLYPKKELIIVLNSDSMNLKRWTNKARTYKNVRVFQLPAETTLGECLNFGTEKARGHYIAKFDDDDYYGPYYLAHIMKDFNNHPDVSVVGKTSYYTYLVNKKALLLEKRNSENCYTDWVAGASLVFKKKLMKQIQFEKLNRAIDWYFLEECKKHGKKIYSTNKDNFVVIRRDPSYHTWKKTDEEFMKSGKLIAYTEDFESIVSTKE